jgi:hypothetical protein
VIFTEAKEVEIVGVVIVKKKDMTIVKDLEWKNSGQEIM